MLFYPETLLNGMARLLDSEWTTQGVSVNSYENDKAYMVQIPVPGAKSEDINVESENGLLNISYSPKESEEKDKDVRWLRKERSTVNFKQSLRLPEDADTQKISAKIEDGLLLVAISKKESTLPKKITVKVN